MIIEELNQACLFVHSSHASVKHPFLSPSERQRAVQLWSNRLSRFRQIHNKGYKWGNKHVDNQGPKEEHAKTPENLNKQPGHRISSPKMKTLLNGSKPKEDAECHTSQVPMSHVQANGLAILDTGASRSVIGIEHVPAVMQKLPPRVRQAVKECPSKVGFRFGNNQIAYSFKQLQIPLEQGKRRIWLLIEVVPKATPFLLSIKAMKSLGASIDLANNTCYLKTLDRSLPLKENTNGLFVIDMADLCQAKQHPNAAAFCVSSSVIGPPPGLESERHAESSGSLGRTQDDCRRDPAEPKGFSSRCSLP